MKTNDNDWERVNLIPGFSPKSFESQVLFGIVTALDNGLAIAQSIGRSTDSNWILATTGKLSYAEWVADHGLNEEEGDPYVNPSGDGIANAIKYALGLNPHISFPKAFTTGEIVIFDNITYHEITIQKNPDAFEAHPTVEFSSDLVNWVADTEWAIVEDHGNLLRIRQDITTQGESFFRLRVDLNQSFAGGRGTAEDPYRISTPEHFSEMVDASANYLLVNDIDFNGSLFAASVVNLQNDFTGYFDGGEYVIRNLSLAGANALGLFRAIGKGGTVANVRIEEANIWGRTNVGILASVNNGTITNSHTHGVISVTDGYAGGVVGTNNGRMFRTSSTAAVTGGSHIGGLVGYNRGDIAGCVAEGPVEARDGLVGGLVGRTRGGGHIFDSHEKGMVTGRGNYVGGLIGRSDDSLVSRCFATGDIVAHGMASYVGGFSGRIELRVTDSFAQGSVSAEGGSRVGGFVGRVNDNALITRSYSIGPVTAPSGLFWGGFSGETRTAQGAKIEASFWDIDSSGVTSSAGGMGKGTLELHSLETFTSAEWDFEKVWNMPESDYPIFRDQGSLLDSLRRERHELAWRDRRVIYNNDGWDWPTSGPVTPEKFLERRTAPLAGTKVDTIFYCTGLTRFYTHRTTKAENWTHNPEISESNWVEELQSQGHDTLQLVIDWSRANQKEIFWSLRMNDNHDWAPKRSWMLTDWKLSNPGFMMFPSRAEAGSYDRYSIRWSSLNYEIEEVRHALLADIEEVIQNYDVDGIELDYFRSPIFFFPQMVYQPVTQYHCDLMTSFMRDVRELIEAYSIKRGRPLLLAVRVPDSVGYSKEIGLDLVRWLEDQLVDILIAGGFFQLNKWGYMVDLGKKYDVPVYACMSFRIVREGPDAIPAWRGESLLALQEGVAGIYLFNAYFQEGYSGNPENMPIFSEVHDVNSLKDLDYLTEYSFGEYAYRYERRISLLRTALLDGDRYLSPEVGRRVPYYMVYEGDVIRVPNDFPTIAEAVGGARDHDEIWVDASHNEEINNLIIDKNISIRSFNPESGERKKGAVILFGDDDGIMFDVRPTGKLMIENLRVECSAAALVKINVEGRLSVAMSEFTAFGEGARGFDIRVTGAGTFVAEQTRFFHSGGNAMIVSSGQGRVVIRNSLLLGENSSLRSLIRGEGKDTLIEASTFFLYGGGALAGRAPESSVVLRNNIFGVNDVSHSYPAISGVFGQVFVEHNLFQQEIGIVINLVDDSSNIIEADPLFVAPGIGPDADFRLQADSPAKGGATRDLHPPLVYDLDGLLRSSSPSIGCYE